LDSYRFLLILADAPGIARGILATKKARIPFWGMRACIFSEH